MAWQAHRENKCLVANENVAKTIASGPQAGEGREVKPEGTYTQSVPAKAGYG